MRTSKQQLYDNLYYGFERRILCFFLNFRNWKKYRSVKFDKSFHQAYKETILPFWARFGIKPKKHWYKHYYTMTGTMDPRYIPDDIHQRYIVPHFDNSIYMRSMEDKNLHTLLFPDINRPETVFKQVDGLYCNDDFSLISREEAFSRLESDGNYIIKPTTDTGMGMDIQFFAGIPSADALSKLLAPYKTNDYIIQRIVKQHPALADYNASSVNTIRIVTLVFQGKPHILSSILRIGHAGSRVDNVSQGGYQAIIRPDGTLDKSAITYQGGKPVQVEQTDDGKPFKGFAVPAWENIRDTALALAEKLPHLRFIGWDFAIDENGEVVLIEFNCQIGQNQGNCGPTFGDLTNEVLADVFHKEGHI